MKLTKLKLENFRCFKDEVCVEFEDITAIIGRNDVGKSTIMDSLAIFFDEAKPDKDDACCSGDRKAVRITCEFDDLPEKVILDADYETSLEAEYLVNADGRLEIRKTYDGSLVSPKLTSVEAFALHPTANGVSDLLQLKKAELVARAGELGIDLTTVNKQANAPIRAAIWQCAEAHELDLAFVSLEKEGGKQIWSALASYLPAFALFKSDRASTDQDAEAQDPLKAAIRDALKAVEQDLLKVQAHVEAEVRRIAEATVQKIKEMDASVAETLNPVIKTKNWDSLFQTSITGDEGIPLNKRGSGIKRLVLLNFFRAKAEKAAVESQKGSVIYAIEEPETSQHPRNQRMLMSALSDLSATAGRQVIVTTHTPMLARSLPDASLRFIETHPNGTRTIVTGGADTNARIAQSLGVLPDHSVKVFVGVEGKHDIAFLKGMSKVLRADGVDVPDVDALEISGELIFFPFGGNNLALWTSRLHPLNRPEFHLYDRDNPPPQAAKYDAFAAQVNMRDGCSAIITSKREMENFLHHEAVVEAYQGQSIVVAIRTPFADFDDVPTIVAQAVHAATAGTPWPVHNPDKCAKKTSRAKTLLNTTAVAKMSRARLAQCDPADEVIGWLRDIGQRVAQ
ncbi:MULTISPECIES: ATP-binding protein [unclassified Bradyrhizobium]|uniref:ATP-binding protein n=1 Tax=unclassified Bradyrhizobium TaxID=2631580 RepID=UPI001FFB3D09|nr:MULTISPECIES: ATP-binding protein [unclassified Bradyrhizobium]MCK1271367.1 ATP-binding protein [Bradyrhizobium sp. 84]MCK1375686.1 ATP-binding protein [Bradyrhizobium sp. 49]MCK1427383.1 ATP-binding protein [Bradyrhizobium sp. 87]